MNLKINNDYSDGDGSCWAADGGDFDVPQINRRNILLLQSNWGHDDIR